MALPSRFVKNLGIGGDNPKPRQAIAKGSFVNIAQPDTAESLVEDTLLPKTPTRKEGLLKRQRKLGRGRASLISGGRINGLSGVLG